MRHGVVVRSAGIRTLVVFSRLRWSILLIATYCLGHFVLRSRRELSEHFLFTPLLCLVWAREEGVGWEWRGELVNISGTHWDSVLGTPVSGQAGVSERPVQHPRKRLPHVWCHETRRTGNDQASQAAPRAAARQTQDRFSLPLPPLRKKQLGIWLNDTECRSSITR